MALTQRERSSPSSAQVVQAQTISNRWRSGLPILGEQDRLDLQERSDTGQPPLLSQLTIGEIQEVLYEAEHRPGSPAHAKEIADIFVFFFSWCRVNQMQLDMIEAVRRVDGYGGKSSIFEKLIEMAQHWAEGDIQANAQYFLQYMMSVVKHFPSDHPLDIAIVMSEVIIKNSRNRPAKYFSFTDPNDPEKMISLNEVSTRFNHSNRMLRILRTHYGSPLERWMHEPFARLILDFRNSTINEQILHSLLDTFDAHIAQAILYQELPESQALIDQGEIGLLVQTALESGLITPSGQWSRRAVDHALRKVYKGQLLEDNRDK